MQEQIRFQFVCVLLSDVSVVPFLSLFGVSLWEIALGVTNYRSSSDITSVCDRRVEHHIFIPRPTDPLLLAFFPQETTLLPQQVRGYFASY